MFSFSFSKDIGIDLGTANTLVFMKGKGIVLREPSVVAVDIRTDTVLAVGSQAKEMIGRTPGSIVAVRPLKDGVIADFQITASMLKHFIRKTVRSNFFSRPRIVICVPSGITEVEKNAVEDAAREAGGKDVELIEEPKNGMYRSRHILLKPSYTIEEQIEPTEYLDSLVAYIKNDSITFEVAAKEHSQDDLSKMNGGLVSNHDLLMNNPAFANVQYTQTKFRREDFGSGKNLNDYMALTKLKPGEVSTAFISEDVKGNPISKIVKLLEVIPTHAASLNEDYLTVEEMALEDKKYKHFEKWLRGKIDEIYVYVDPDFRDGEFMYKNWIK